MGKERITRHPSAHWRMKYSAPDIELLRRLVANDLSFFPLKEQEQQRFGKKMQRFRDDVLEQVLQDIALFEDGGELFYLEGKLQGDTARYLWAIRIEPPRLYYVTGRYLPYWVVPLPHVQELFTNYLFRKMWRLGRGTEYDRARAKSAIPITTPAETQP